jgi:uncharacterized membrane protein YeaQ/YmgE (transglycosylase-associated protein family)
MTIVDFLLLGIIAAVCGLIGQALVGNSVGGCLVSAVVGYLGALIGMWVARQFGLPELVSVRIGTQSFPIIWSIIGSALLVAVLSLFRRRY